MPINDWYYINLFPLYVFNDSNLFSAGPVHNPRMLQIVNFVCFKNTSFEVSAVETNLRPSDVLDGLAPMKPSDQGKRSGAGRGRGKGRGRGEGKAARFMRKGRRAMMRSLRISLHQLRKQGIKLQRTKSHAKAHQTKQAKLAKLTRRPQPTVTNLRASGRGQERLQQRQPTLTNLRASRKGKEHLQLPRPTKPTKPKQTQSQPRKQRLMKMRSQPKEPGKPSMLQTHQNPRQFRREPRKAWQRLRLNTKSPSRAKRARPRKKPKRKRHHQAPTFPQLERESWRGRRQRRRSTICRKSSDSPENPVLTTEPKRQQSRQVRASRMPLGWPRL